MITDDPVKILERETKFPEYNFEDKTTNSNSKARVSMLIKKDLRYSRLTDLEDQENPMFSINIKEKKGKHLVVSAVYRQWKAPGESSSSTAEGISRQVRRL